MEGWLVGWLVGWLALFMETLRRSNGLTVPWRRSEGDPPSYIPGDSLGDIPGDPRGIPGGPQAPPGHSETLVASSTGGEPPAPINPLEQESDGTGMGREGPGWPGKLDWDGPGCAGVNRDGPESTGMDRD